MIRARLGFLLASLTLLLTAGLGAQEIQDGEIIADIVWEGIPPERQQAFEDLFATKKGAPFDAATLDEDIENLWELKRLRPVVTAERVPGKGLVLYIAIDEAGVFDRLELVGNDDFTRTELLEAIGVRVAVRIREADIAPLVNKMREFYLEKGYYFVEIRTRVRKDLSLIIFEICEGPEVSVGTVRFHGNTAIPASRLFGIGTRLWSVVNSSGPFISFPFVIGGTPFDERRLDEDAVALARLYRGEGFRDVQIAYDFRFSPDGTWADIDFTIEEGPLYRIRGVEIVGNQALTTAELKGVVRSRRGDEFTDAHLQEDIRALTEYYGRQGYLYGLDDGFRIEDRYVYEEERDEVTIYYEVHEGPRRRLRDVDVRGNYKTKRDVIMREILLDPGEIMDAEKIQRTIARLQSLRYFEDERGIPAVRYQFHPDPQDPEKVDWLIDVEEGQTGVFNIGGGLASNSGPFLTFRWSNTNFALSRPPSSVWTAIPEMLFGDAFSGDGQSLAFSASPGLELSRFNIEFSEPDLFGDQRDTVGLDLELFHTLRLWRTHEEIRTGGIIGLSKNLSRELAIGLKWRSEIVEFDDIVARAPSLIWDQEGKSHVHGMGVHFRYRDVDYPLRPTTGYGFSGEYFLTGGPFQGDFDFHEITVGGEYYIPLKKDSYGRSQVLAFNTRLGWSQGFAGTKDVPYQDRFFLGGLNSLRSFNIRGAGPVVNDLPLGGEAMWRLNIEYQFPLMSSPVPHSVDEYEWMRGYVWNDWGGLGVDIHDDTMREVRSAMGVGIRFRFPFLPQASLDLSVGYPLMREDTDDVRIFQFQLNNL